MIGLYLYTSYILLLSVHCLTGEKQMKATLKDLAKLAIGYFETRQRDDGHCLGFDCRKSGTNGHP